MILTALTLSFRSYTIDSLNGGHMPIIVGSLFPVPDGEDLADPRNGVVIYQNDNGSPVIAVVHSITQAQVFVRKMGAENELHQHIAHSAMPQASDDAVQEFGGQCARALMAAFIHYAAQPVKIEFITPYPCITTCAAWPAKLLLGNEAANMMLGFLNTRGEPNIGVACSKTSAEALVNECTWAPQQHVNQCRAIIAASGLPALANTPTLRIVGYAAGVIHELVAAMNG